VAEITQALPSLPEKSNDFNERQPGVKGKSHSYMKYRAISRV